MSVDSKQDKNKKITDFTTKISSTTTKDSNPITNCKWSISNLSSTSPTQEVKKQTMETSDKTSVPDINATTSPTTGSTTEIESNTTLQKALGPLIMEFRILTASVDTIHADYVVLKQTISKQKEEVEHELANKIESNTIKLDNTAEENRALKWKNDSLKDRLTKIEQSQLSNNVIIMGIQEEPFESYHTTKLRVQEIITITIDSGNASEDLETAKSIEITCCSRVGKFRHNHAHPISVTFLKRDDKEALLSCK